MKFTIKSCIGKTWTDVSSVIDDVRSSGKDSFEIDIRNPKAIMRNVKATVGIKLKLKGGLKSFYFILPTAAGGFIDGNSEDNEINKTRSLSELGLKNKDLIYLVGSSPEMELVNFLVKCCDEHRAAIEQEPVASDHNVKNIRKEPSAQSGKQLPIGEKRLRSDQRLSETAEVEMEPVASRGSSSSFMGSHDEDEVFSGDDEEWEDEISLDSDVELGEFDGIDDDSAEMLIDLSSEQLEMLNMILDLPDAGNLLERFSTAPEEVMQTVQSSKPELFELITKNHQIFLQLMEGIKILNINSSDSLSELREFAHMLSSVQGTDAEEITDENSTPAMAVSETLLGEEAAPKITSLMELGGFSREQCMRALMRCDMDMERAANFLFENFAG
eukprot:Tbor_TRINITY_DN5712_c0_g7::TRINITY_DN5712_c0_g7_i1::g.19956::m.19956